MSLFDDLRAWMDVSIGNRGALRNCRAEIERRQEIDAAVKRLRRRVAQPLDLPTDAVSA